jgi:pimeloyl-ACP methyl ester carboxylesterase
VPDWWVGVSTSVSNDWKREVKAAPRSRILLEPISRKVGSCESRAASRQRKGSGHWAQQEKPAEVNTAILEFLADLRK